MHPAVIVLCNDIVVFALRVSGTEITIGFFSSLNDYNTQTGSLKLHSAIALNGASIVDRDDDGEMTNVFEIKGGNNNVFVACFNAESKTMWLDAFQHAIAQADLMPNGDLPDLLQMTVSIDLTLV